MLRVRQLIDPLAQSYNRVLTDGLLPANIDMVLSCNKTVKYPPFIYDLCKTHKWIFSHYGVFMESLLREMRINSKWMDELYNLYVTTGKLFCEKPELLVTKQQLLSCMGRYVNISKFIGAELDTELLYDHEYIYNSTPVKIGGHPDLVEKHHTVIYDVKTTTKFNSPAMKNVSILQICAYLALARHSGHNPKVIGIVLPFQQQVLTYDVEWAEYDHQPFLKLLHELAAPKYQSLEDRMTLQLYANVLGFTTKKVKGKVSNTLQAYYKDGVYTRPCQFFMRGNISGRSITLQDDDIVASLTFVEQFGIKFYIHSPYIINLCHPCGNKTKDDHPQSWAIDLLREELQLANTVGSRGVVVHTGKGLQLSQSDAENAMYHSTLQCLDAATIECPLMIETPVDKGSELLGTPESLAAFYNRFTDDQQQVLKICVDTCHVFAAGYLPQDYINTLEQLVPKGSIQLIHLNDSQWIKGSAHDGHMPIGSGFIGLHELLKVIVWASSRGISMVYE